MPPKYGDIFNFEFFQNSYIYCPLARANSNFCKTDVFQKLELLGLLKNAAKMRRHF